jgi:hypothetical protein
MSEIKLPKPLEKLAQEAARNHERYDTGDNGNDGEYSFFDGASFLYSTLLNSAPTFDKAAAIDRAKHEDSDGYLGFLSGSEWQHSQDAANISALQIRVEELEETVIPPTQYLDALRALSDAKEFLHKIEIDKLRLSVRKLSAARDAYARAMTIALKEGTYANKAAVNRAIEEALAAVLKKERN